MTYTPLVSIVLPTFNGSRYLDQAIQSCLAQTYANWELIIVDDGSTDDTPARIARYVAADSRIRSVRHGANRKLPGALNSGFSLASGDFLTWTSDDNCYRADGLAEMVTFLDTYPEVDVVYTDYSSIDETGRLLRQVRIWDPDVLLKGNGIGPCFLYRRRVYEKTGGYTEDLFLAEDYDFWLRASVWFQLRPLHKDLYLYRRHSDSLTATNAEQIRLAAERALARNLPHMQWAGRTGRTQTYLRLAKEARARHDGKAALNHLLRAVRYSPGRLLFGAAFGLVRRALQS